MITPNPGEPSHKRKYQRRHRKKFGAVEMAREESAICQHDERCCDPDVSVRVEAAKALGKLGADAKAAVPALMAAQSDGAISVQNAARAALKLVDKK